MRFSVILVPAFLLLAGTGFFLARPKENAALAAVEAKLDRSEGLIEDAVADQYDSELVRNALQSKHLSDAESTAMIAAAGRRYMRRKMAYNAALQSGTAAPQTLESLQRQIDLARRICNLTESLAHPIDLDALQAELDIERRLAFMPSGIGALAERHDGRLTFTDADLKQLEREFLATFGRPLPVSARGDSAVHRSMGFDHRGRTDVALRPDTTEGVWVRHYLTGKGVSFFAFRGAAAGKATGAHIHIGPASGKLAPRS
jgi:hypothetical protein